MFLLLAALLLNPAPSWGHITHDCHELRVHHYALECSPVPAPELRSLGYLPGRDAAIAFIGRPGAGSGPNDVIERTTIWVDVFNGDRVDTLRF